MTEQERKEQIAFHRAELKKLMAVPKSDWHTAFEAFLRFETYKYKGIEIRPEVEIGLDPPRTDYVILTGEETQEFEESIFQICRRINILEYKNPHDALNDRVIHKIIGYANLMIGTAEHEGDVPKDQVTLSIFRSVKNPELFKEMEANGTLEKTAEPGIYRVIGLTELPFQIVITSELEGEKYAACRALTDKANEADVERVISEGSKARDAIRNYYRIFVDLIAQKNLDVFEEIGRDRKMTSVLREILKDDLEQAENKGREETTTLINFLWENGRGEDAKRAGKDKDFLDQLLTEYKESHS